MHSAGLANHPALATVDLAEQLAKLAELKTAGVLSEEEFSAAKAKLIDN